MAVLLCDTVVTNPFFASLLFHLKQQWGRGQVCHMELYPPTCVVLKGSPRIKVIKERQEMALKGNITINIRSGVSWLLSSGSFWQSLPRTDTVTGGLR